MQGGGAVESLQLEIAYLCTPYFEMKTIPYGRQNITQQDIDAVVEVLRSDTLTQGPKIREFEEKFASYVGARHAVAVANGTAALHLAALALHVNEKSRVITTPMTFAASANCIRYCGGQVAFADVDPQSGLIDINKVRALLTSSARGTYQGIIPVDYAGAPVNMEAFRKLADEFGLWIIEDACHAPGAYFVDARGRKQLCGNGAFADLAIFSFHPVKHVATGEGGMITTNNEILYKKLLALRTHGITKDPDLLSQQPGGWYYEMKMLGFNYRLTDFQAALGVSQLSRAEEGLNRRRVIAEKYAAAFKDLPLQLPQNDPQAFSAYHLYVVQTEKRLQLYNYLHEKGIKVQVHYIPVHLMPYYRELKWKKGDFPLAEAFYDRCLSLPMFPTLSDDDIGFVIGAVREFFGAKR